MKNRQPIKRSAPLVGFSRDHHFGLLCSRNIREALQSGKALTGIIDNLNAFAKDELLPHFRAEEEMLFPLLDASDDLRVQAENEHAEIYWFLDAAESGNGSPGLLYEFADCLDKHIRFEERVLFGHLEKTISPELLNTINWKIHNTVNHPQQGK